MHDDRIFPISIRPDLVIKIQDIPHDLTQAEATKISDVIQAMANVSKRK